MESRLNMKKKKIIHIPSPRVYPIERIPYICPVCNGRGKVPPDFYNPEKGNEGGTSMPYLWEICKSCGGIGIIIC